MNPASLFHVQPTSGVAIYRQIMEQVIRLSAGGQLPAEEFLPSVRQMAESLQVNPMTISKAYSLLERDGVIELVRGMGMRLRPTRIKSTRRHRLEQLQPLANQLAAQAQQLAVSIEDLTDLLHRCCRALNEGTSHDARP